MECILWTGVRCSRATLYTLYVLSGHFITVLAWAEVVSKRRVRDKWEFYMHYVNCKLRSLVIRYLTRQPLVNKRLDEWVCEARLDIEQLQLPRKDSKMSSLARSSRPSSPDIQTPTPLIPHPKKLNGVGRKRKHESVEVRIRGRWRGGGGS